MNREQLEAWLTIEGWSACSGKRLSWMYKPYGPWVFKWMNDQQEDGFGTEYTMDASDRSYGLEGMKKEYIAEDGWPDPDTLQALIKLAIQEGFIK